MKSIPYYSLSFDAPNKTYAHIFEERKDYVFNIASTEKLKPSNRYMRF